MALLLLWMTQDEQLVRPFIAFALLLAGVCPLQGFAQTSSGRVETGFHVSSLRLSEFGIADTGAGVNATWWATPIIAIDGALTVFPANRGFMGDRIGSQQRTLGLIGARSGIRRGRVELFGRARGGLLRFAAQEGTVCVALSIFPTPIGCQLATGHTAFATDLGGGLSAGLNDRLHLRVEAGDLMIRYGLQTYRPSGKLTDGFWSHNLQAGAGLGWRF
jgi:hypothetical protein